MIQVPASAWHQGKDMWALPQAEGRCHLQEQLYWKILQDQTQPHLQILILCIPHHMQGHIIDYVQEGKDMALIQLEGVWQNHLATFQVHGNINIINELRGKLVKFNLFELVGGNIPFPLEVIISIYLDLINCSNYCIFCLLSVVICNSMNMVADGCRNMSEWIKLRCPLRPFILLSLYSHFPHPNWLFVHIFYVFC